MQTVQQLFYDPTFSKIVLVNIRHTKSYFEIPHNNCVNEKNNINSNNKDNNNTIIITTNMFNTCKVTQKSKSESITRLRAVRDIQMYERQ